MAQPAPKKFILALIAYLYLEIIHHFPYMRCISASWMYNGLSRVPDGFLSMFLNISLSSSWGWAWARLKK